MDLMIPRLEKFAAEGMFGEINVLRVNPSPNGEKSAQFQSQLGFFEVDLVTRKGKIRKVPVVVKLQLENLQPRHYDAFANEVNTYGKVLPGLGAKGFYPTMYYGFATRGKDPKQDILILEDLRLQGFKVPKDVVLDPNHIHLAMRTLGEFHGLSYKMKVSSAPGKFNELKDALTEMFLRSPKSNAFVTEAIHRGFKKDLESSPDYSVLKRAYKKLTSQSAWELMRKFLAPEEPFAAIVHGDYLKNNVLYRYDENGNPCDLKMFDFATTMYSDPAIDISTFLYMHTSQGREEHWSGFLKSYWDGVLSVVSPKFTFKEFMNNFAKKAVYGYIISSFFLPITMDPKGQEEFSGGVEEMSDEQLRELARTLGGEVSTAAVTSIVRHLHDEGYLEEYLLHFKQ